MVKYYFQDDNFIIEDYLHASKFSSFLPGVAGIKGKPLWAFYNNRGQCMAGFGVTDKDTPITPFDSAELCYQNIALKSFRTFIKINDSKYIEAFSSDSNNTKMIINNSYISIEEDTSDYFINITYSTISNKKYPGLVRNLSFKSKLDGKNTFTIVDGLPIFFPHGLSNICYKELVSLMAAYCQVFGLNDHMPFVKFKTSTGDCSIVSEVSDGNAFVAIDENNERLNNFIDIRNVFGDDSSLIKPLNFLNKSYKELIKEEQQTENKLPCAFSISNKILNKDQECKISTVYGYFDSEREFKEELGNIKVSDIEDMIEETRVLISNLLSPLDVKTGNNLFNLYSKQSLLDNNLRGGFPISLTNDNKNPYYVYSRKHGDMERDYNSFVIPSKYYSSGPGNFRDVLQNRRSDLYLYPFIDDFNIRLFFNLIQIDGQNPLNVSPTLYKLEPYYKSVKLDAEFINILKEGYVPSSLYEYLDSKNIEDNDELFKDIINHSSSEIKANFAEGYWVDHWTYLVDLLENYRSVYPDKVNDLLLNEGYKYFYSLVYVNPRSEKYSYVDKNTIRQYGAIDLIKLKEECEKFNLDIKKTYWLKDKKDNEVKTNLLGKIFNLIMVKFSTLDSMQMGIEMECEKPGWNDAMNGLPGMFSSAMSESVELLRLTNFLLNEKELLKVESLSLLEEQYELYSSLKENINLLNSNKLSSFEYWDKATSARETLREKAHYGVTGNVKSLSSVELFDLLNNIKVILSKGIKKAKEIYNGILPSYIIWKVKDYELTDKVNHLGYKVVKVKSFELVKIPFFLEASARSFKLGKEYADEKEYNLIKKTGAYDKKLKIYKTCEDIDDAPFEIGRVHAFTKGWLERECDFLHMTYKYLLGLLKAGLYKEFYEEIHNNLVCYMDPYIYGRSPIENSSFIVPSCNPDKSIWGKGYFARLTGANAEFLDMLFYMFIGENIFTYVNDELVLSISPKLDKSLFDENNECSITLFNGLTIKVINTQRHGINTYDKHEFKYVINNIEYKEVKGQLALDIRDGKVKEIIIKY